MVTYVGQIDVLASFDAACLIAGKALCAMHDMEEVHGEQLQILPCAPDESGLADEFTERYPDDDFPDGYGNRRILITFDTASFDERLHWRIVQALIAIVDSYNKQSGGLPLCFDTFFFQLNP